MALGDSYATLPDLKSRLNIGDTTDDARLTAALKAASRGIDKTCHRQFNDAGTATARIFYPDDLLFTNVDDFSTTTGLVVATDAGFAGTYSQTWQAADYQLNPLNGIVDGEPGWPYWRINAIRALWFPIRAGWPTGNAATVQVTARWGWAAVPDAVGEACLMVAAEIFKMKDAPFGVAGYGDYGAVRVRKNPIACMMIGPYAREPVLVG